MPGLFDSVTPFLSGLHGGILGSIGGGLANAQNYNTLSQDLGPGDAQLALSRPDVFNSAWQRQLFISQLQDLQKRNPGMGLNELLYRMTPEANKEQYGYAPGQPIEPGPGVKIPMYIHGGQPVIGLPGAGIQSQPSQQPAAAQPQPQGPAPAAPGMAQMQPYIDWAQQLEARKAAAVKAAEQTATAQPDLPILQTRAQEVIGRLQRIRDNPELPNVVGGPLGIKGRAGPLGQGQSDLLSDIQDANNALQGDLFTSMRTISNGGRPPSPGAMKEMRITDLNARTGTVQAYKNNIDTTIKQVQNEYEAAWKARNSPDAYKPNWGKPSAPINNISVPPQAAAYLKANPHLRTQFDAKYGNGAALSVLGQ